jgi:isochorismate synthase
MENLRGESVKTQECTLKKSLDMASVIEACEDHNFAYAAYQQPQHDQKEFHLIIDLSAGRNISRPDLDEMGSGFIFHPYSADHHRIKFIGKDIHLVQRSAEKEIEIRHSNVSSERFIELFEKETNSLQNVKASNRKKSIPTSTSEQKADYVALTKKTIDNIKDGNFQKAVLARSKKLALPNDFSIFEFFELLAQEYKNALVYLVSIPETGTWIGATPETLISIDKNRLFRTVALAATQASDGTIDLEDTTWSQKDIEEQAMVSRYIINCFKKIRLREFEEIGPKTHYSGNLVHLKTDYIVEMDQVAFPQLGTVMLDLLHPTSAVCGMPKEPAMDFLMQNEDFDREYFTGYLGPVNVQNETDIFVNLRCMKIIGDQARLYAGAGIIANSNPEKEWNETEIKMETILKVLRKLY